jgi:prophage DNA circulation protein
MADALAENTLDAQFEGVPFPVSDVTTDGGRSFVPHTSFKGTGADLQNTGLDAYTGTMVVPMVNADSLVTKYGSPLYPDLRDRLLARFEQTNGVGRLIHPTRGPMDAMITKWPERATAQYRGGVILTITFHEHNASSLILLAEDTSAAPADYESVAATQASNADSFMRTLDPEKAAGWTEVTPVVDEQLSGLASASTFSEIDAAVRTMLAAVDGNIGLAGFASASSHDVIVSLYTLQATLYQLRDRLLGQLTQARTIVTARSMAAWEIAEDAYGDASLAQLITQANSFEDPLSIPAGVAVLLPAA